MNTEIFFHETTITSGNTTLPIKKWSTSTIPGLGSVDESIESIVTEQNVENNERKLGGNDDAMDNPSRKSSVSSDKSRKSSINSDKSRQNSLVDMEESNERENVLTELNTKVPRFRPRHNSIVGIVRNFGGREKRSTLANINLPNPLEDKRGRRRSWSSKLTHLQKETFGKLDRKRRQGVVSAKNRNDDSRDDDNDDDVDDDDDERLQQGYQRHKRKSWWNIFVPEDLNRARRSSTDAGRTQLQVPIPRPKSHSVDHGISAPFDFDSLRNKVERRFESVGDSDGDLEKEKKKASPPINTIPYTVQTSDTLNSVAARFDITPSELRKLNRLASNLIFPGQLLQVPEKKTTASGDDNADDTLTSLSTSEDGDHQDLQPVQSEEQQILDNLRPVSPKPGHIERAAPTNRRTDLREARFLKINVKHITDGQGVVAGVLLVTPNAVMFDPNVSDPLVIEHGPESYGVIAPMEFVVNAAIYYDIAHMKVGHADNKTDSKPEIYYAKSNEKDTGCLESQGSPGRDSLLVKDETFPELAPKGSSDEENESISSYRDGCAFPKAFDRDLVTPTNIGGDKETTPTNTTCSSSLTEKEGDEQQHQTTQQLLTQQSLPESAGAGSGGGGGGGGERKLEERRASSLDQHWALPKSKQNSESFDSQSENDKIQLGESAQGVDRSIVDGDEDTCLVKLSCHDSGIDIREAEVPVIQPTKKAVSDADIILSGSNDCVLLVNQPLPPGEHKKKSSSVSFSLEDDQQQQQQQHPHQQHLSKSSGSEDEKSGSEGKKAKMLKRLSYPLSWMEGTFVNDGDKESLPSLPTSADSQHSSVFSKVFSRRPSVGTFMKSDSESKSQSAKHAMLPKLDYRSMVSVDDMPELFVSFDKLIPRPARSCEDPPLYLRLRMGKPVNKKIPKSTPIMSYGKKKMRPEYWFSVPRNRVDELYNFLQLWVPLLYGELDETDCKLRGYELVESDTELWDEEEIAGGDYHGDGADGDGDLGELTRESWEVLSMSEELRRALYASSVGSLDMEMFIPDLVGTTEILTEEHRRQLCRHLPARAEGYLWTLVFSTSQHGFSLNSMYRKMTRLESPILLVVEDTDHNVFGALTSCSLKVSDHFYGTGESLLFRFNPEFSAYQWTGDNMYFIKGNNESLAIGAGDGKFGLWLDGDLYQGRSERCNTYSNEPLSSQEDFVVKTLECWAFI